VLLAIISAIPGSDGQPAGIAAWTRDITRRVEMSERLTAAERLAGLGTLSSGVAHNFNNILGGVATFVDFALTTNDPAAARRALEMTAEATGRVAKVTQSLLTFAEQDSGRKDLADLTEVVLTFAHLVERPLRDRGIHLQLALNPVPIVAVEANRMHQVLGNLLSNAEEAMPTGGTITLGLAGDEDFIELSFADSGVGIKPEHLPHIFEPFFTTKGLLAGGDGGNPGLGLSVVHGLVTEMGGAIVAETPAAGGACFRIRFPRPEEEVG
jgi:signal transduction histidine kinase